MKQKKNKTIGDRILFRVVIEGTSGRVSCMEIMIDLVCFVASFLGVDIVMQLILEGNSCF